MFHPLPHLHNLQAEFEGQMTMPSWPNLGHLQVQYSKILLDLKAKESKLLLLHLCFLFLFV